MKKEIIILKKYIKLAIFILLTSNILYAQQIDKILFMTENYPPYNFKSNNKLEGIAVELLLEILKKVNAKQTRKDIVLIPWQRGYHYTLTKNNHALFSTTRTKEREKLFKWVGPISKTSIGLIAKKSKKIKIKNISQISKYSVGVVREDIGEQLILKLDIQPKYIRSIGGSDASNKLILMLQRNRFDLLAYEINVIKWAMKKNNFTLSNYENIYTLKDAELYYAFHKDTPDETIKLLQSALDSIKKEGLFKKILSQDKYTR